MQRTLASVSAFALLTPALPAQTAAQPEARAVYTAPLAEHTKTAPVLGVWKPYVPHSLPQPVLRNSDRLHALIRDNKLLLSLDDAVALTLENNYDIAIARYNMDIANTDLLVANAGGTVRGVPTGLLTGTPGGAAATTTTAGATGGGAGGTTEGVGGSAGGLGGLVLSTQNAVGSPLDPRDPTLSATISVEHQLVPIATPIPFGGESSLQENTSQYNFTYTQGFATGTLATVTFSNQRLVLPSTISPLVFPFNPQLSSSWKASVRQHLLLGWGISNNQRQILIAKNNIKVTDASFRAQVISTVAQIQNIYWDLVNAYENVKVQETALDFARRTLSDNQKQVEIGTMAPIEVVQAKSQVATATQNLIAAQTNLAFQQLLMKNAIARNFDDPELTAAQVIPIDSMALVEEPMAPVQEMVNYALANRPELIQSELNLRNGEINNAAAKNALLPTLDAVGYYGGAGLNGNYGDVFGNLVNRDYPDKGAYLSLSIPIRNRIAQANQIRSELEYRQNQLNHQQQKNQVTLQVRNAAFALQQARAGVESARAAHEFARESLEAEQKKYELGASTSYLVMQEKNSETQAASNYVAALSNYEKARVALEQVTASILDRNGIHMEDAISGQVTHQPSIPGLKPNPTPRSVAEPPAAP